MAKEKKKSKPEEDFDKEESKHSEKKEEVCEIFEVEKKDGKESAKAKDSETEPKEVKACDSVEKKHADSREIESQKKTLRNILVTIAIFVLLVVAGIYYINSARHFEYKGISGNVVKEGDLIFYEVPIPMVIKAQKVTYMIYIRNNPEELDKIPFVGEIPDFDTLSTFSDGAYRIVLNFSDEFNCDGDETIAVGNMLNLKALNMKIVSDENASCDKFGRYIYLNVKKGDVSRVKQMGEACYELEVRECEILEVTERFMIEAIAKYYEINGLA
jgi:hypothetical protein